MLILGDGKLPLDITGDLPPHYGTFSRQFDFSFVYHGSPFTAHLAEQEGQATLTTTTRLGPLPFSAESARARASLQTVIEAANQRFGPIFTVIDGQIHLTLGAVMPAPIGAVTVVTALTRLLVPLKPYLLCLGLYLTPGWHNGAPAEPRLRPEYRRRAPRPSFGGR